MCGKVFYRKLTSGNAMVLNAVYRQSYVLYRVESIQNNIKYILLLMTH